MQNGQKCCSIFFTNKKARPFCFLRAALHTVHFVHTDAIAFTNAPTCLFAMLTSGEMSLRGGAQAVVAIFLPAGSSLRSHMCPYFFGRPSNGQIGTEVDRYENAEDL